MTGPRPAANKWSKTKHITITKECMWAAWENKPSLPKVSTINNEFEGAILDQDTGKLLEYRQLVKMSKYKEDWQYLFGNKIGGLAQGMTEQLQCTNTIFFTHQHRIPAHQKKDVTYGQIIFDIHHGKAEPNQTRLTMGGDRIQYPGDCSTSTKDLFTVKIMLKCFISTTGAKFMRWTSKFFISTHWWKGTNIFGCKWVTFQKILLNNTDYKKKQQMMGTSMKRNVWSPASWKLGTSPIGKKTWLLPKSHHTRTFATQTMKHTVLSHSWWFWCQKHQKTKCGTPPNNFNTILQGVHWLEREKYVGLTLEWDYKYKQVHLSMPRYIEASLTRFQHKHPCKLQQQQYPNVLPQDGAQP